MGKRNLFFAGKRFVELSQSVWLSSSKLLEPIQGPELSADYQRKEEL